MLNVMGSARATAMDDERFRPLSVSQSCKSGFGASRELDQPVAGSAVFCKLHFSDKNRPFLQKD